MAQKALLIGINNYKQVGDLRGCENDVKNMKALLTSTLGFETKNIKSLLNQEATKTKIKSQMRWLFQGIGKNDRVLLHFSGHGSYTADEDDDDDGGVDELICLYDMDFDNRESYLTDDDLRQWTMSLPKGARLVVVLDCCHSGTGTKMLVVPETGVTRAVQIKATIERRVEHGASSSEPTEIPFELDDALDLDNRAAVLARFVPPPPRIVQLAAQRGQRRSLHRAVADDMNHVLLAACRDDQTAADAFIGNSFNGAFSFHLCKLLRDVGPSLRLRDVHQRLKAALSHDHFEQVPQLEGVGQDEPIFGAREAAPESHGAESVKPNRDSTLANDRELLQRIVGSGEGLSVQDRRQALDLLKQILSASSRGGRARSSGQRQLIYVHGIGEHIETYSDDWWDALQPHVSVFGEGRLGETRREVLWSNLVNARAFSSARRTERNLLAMEIKDTLLDRLDRHAQEAVAQGEAAPRSVVEARGAGIPGFGSVDDFTQYLLDENLRGQIIHRFTDEVRRSLEEGAELDIISHSWGTVVAYEGLRELEDEGVNGHVHTFYTVGAALSIPPVKVRLRPANRDGRRPIMVQRWINLDAIGDIVGGPLRGRPFAVDDDFPALEPVGCSRFLGIINPSCAHSSYFNVDNTAVNRDIFARFINA